MRYSAFRLTNDWKFVAVIVILSIIMIADIFLVNYHWDNYFSPIESSFLPSNSEGHIPQKLVFWLLPIHLLLLPPSWHVTNVRTCYDRLCIARMSKKKYLRTCLLSSFVLSSIAILIPLLANLFLAFVLNKEGAYSSNDLLVMANPNTLSSLGAISRLEATSPMFGIISSMAYTSFFFGVFGVFLCAMSFVFSKLRYLFFIALLLWFVFISGGHSILLVFQPFTEYSQEFRLGLLAIYSGALLAASYILYRCKVNADEY
jgi:hypothetical protein